MANKLVSVAMATYNGEKYLVEQLDSILTQTHPIYEIIIVDDGSSDKTLDILNSYQDKFGNIKVYPNSENLGVVKSFERAIMLTSGDYIALSDQDDVWSNDKIAKLVDALGDNLLIHSDILVVDEALQPLQKYQFTHKRLTRGLYVDYLLFNDVTGCTLLMKRELLDLGLPIPNGVYMHDHYLALIAAFYKRITYLDVQLVKYRQHSSNVVGAKAASNKHHHQLHAQHYLRSLEVIQHLPIFKHEVNITYAIEYHKAIVERKLAKYNIYAWCYQCFGLTQLIRFIQRCIA